MKGSFDVENDAKNKWLNFDVGRLNIGNGLHSLGIVYV